MKSGKFTPWAIALLSSTALVIATSIAISFIYAHERININNHVLTRLDSISELIDLWSSDFKSGARQLADDPKFTKLIVDFEEGRADQTQTNNLLDQWFRPIYLSRGYEGHSIISTNYQVILASSPAYVGKPVSTAVSRRAIQQAFEKGVAIGHISQSTYAVRDINGTENNDTVFQLGCAKISHEGKVLGVLCLRQNPYRKFFAMLATGFSGQTGEAYAIDKDANIISPTRFDRIKINEHPQSGNATLKKDLQARAPRTGFGRGYTPDLKTEKVITKAAQLALSNGESDYVENYPDYRGVAVVGAVKWIPELEMGIVIEQDVSEVYGPYQISRRAIILLTAFAILLINILTISLINSRKKIALREERLRAFLDNFPGAAHMRDAEGKYLMVNKLVEETAEMSQHELIGTFGEKMPLPREYFNLMNIHHQEIVKSGKATDKIVKTDKVFRSYYEWVKVIRFPVFDTETHKVSAVGTIVQDITEQMRSAQQLEEIRLNLEKIVEQRTVQLEAARIEAEQAAQTKANFMANMSHELRTPMNAIIGLSHLATLVSDDPKLRSYLERIHQSSNHLLSIINDILDFSKIEAGKMTIDRIEFSIEDLMDKVVSFVGEKATEKKLELLVDIEHDVPIFLKGDPLRIGQILINFANNAVKFTSKGEVVLRVRKIFESGDRVNLSFEVQDTGIGISEEDQKQLFKPFHQLDTSFTRQFEGTGLGLAISKNLIEQMEGSISLQSKVNIGSLFSIELSLQKSSDSTLTLFHTTQTQYPKNLKTLILCNNRTANKILSSMFYSLSTESHSVTNIDDTLSYLKAHTDVDLIFIYDADEPFNSFTCAEKLRSLLDKKCPKIILAKTINKNEMSLDLEHLFDSILYKPVLLSNLVETLNGIVKPKNISEDSPENFSRFTCLQSCSILLVDDHPVNQEVAKELLAVLNIHIDVVSSGYDALERLEQKTFDLVLMDVQMPGIDGYETTKRIRAQDKYKNLPIVAMTANALSGDRKKCLDIGMNDYISKPIIPNTLFETLLKWYTPSKKLQELTPLIPAVIKTPVVIKNTEIAESDYENLSGIAGLDIDQAIQRLLNNKNFYISLLKMFVSNRRSIADDIEEAAIKGDFEEASRIVHSFKSLVGSIGALELHRITMTLETELSQSILNHSTLTELNSKLQTLIFEINGAFSPEQSNSEP